MFTLASAWRLLVVFVAVGMGAAVAARAAAECDPQWEEEVRKGNSVSAKYTAQQDGVCEGACLEEKLYFYRRAVELCPESDEAHTDMGDALERLGEYPAAEEDYREAIRINPGRWEAHFGLADLVFQAGRYAEAVQHYDRGLAIEPGDALARERRACAAGLQGQGIVEAAAIERCLGGKGEPIVKLGIGGLKEMRRLPLRIEFDTDKDTIRPEAERQLTELGKALRGIIDSDPDAAFLIEGHTDARGTDAYNEDLSRRRAQRVARALVERFGIAEKHLAITGFGESRLLSRGDSDAAHQINRRVEVVRYKLGELGSLERSGAVARVRADVAPLPGVVEAATLEAAVFYEDAESRPQKLREGATLRSGDGYRVYFRPGRDQHLYIVQEDAKRKLFAIFPNPAYGYQTSAVEEGKEYWVPREKWLELDETRGPEVIYFIASSRPRADIEDLLQRSAQRSGQIALADSESRYEILSSRRIGGKLGVLPTPREGRNVKVVAQAGTPTELSADALVGRGVELVYTLSFQHQ